MTPPTGPRTAFDILTEAWQQDFNSLDAFIATLHRNGYEIRPIEAEARAGIDVERLARALELELNRTHPAGRYDELAAAIAAAYGGQREAGAPR